jgi:hypothetical protein
VRRGLAGHGHLGRPGADGADRDRGRGRPVDDLDQLDDLHDLNHGQRRRHQWIFLSRLLGRRRLRIDAVILGYRWRYIGRDGRRHGRRRHNRGERRRGAQRRDLRLRERLVRLGHRR